MVDPLKTAANSVRAWLADGGTQYIPVISEIYKLITGRKLKLAKALFFMLAIPVTYASKALLGKWPSELGVTDQLIGTNRGTVAIVEEDFQSSGTGAPAHLTRSLPGDVSSSEFVYTSRSEEEQSDESPRKEKKTWWTLLKVSSIVMTGIIIPLQAAVDISKAEGKRRKDPKIFIIIYMAKVVQKFLDRGASMVYSGDYFDEDDNKKNNKKTVLTKGDKKLFRATWVFEVGGAIFNGAAALVTGTGEHLDTPETVVDACESLAEVAKGGRLIGLAHHYGEVSSFQRKKMVFQGVTGLLKGVAQMVKTVAKCKYVKMSIRDKVLAIGIAAHLNFFAKVYPFGLGSVILQLKGPDKGDTEDEGKTNNATWTACHAYL
ncbi:unnamed protein product [Ectocarpus sp. 12 AP-2014]